MDQKTIAKCNISEQRNKWCLNDIRILKAIFSNVSNQKIANIFKRSIKSIASKAKSLGLKKTKKYLKNRK